MSKIHWDKMLHQAGFMKLDWIADPQGIRSYLIMAQVCKILVIKMKEEETKQAILINLETIVSKLVLETGYFSTDVNNFLFNTISALQKSIDHTDYS